MKPMKKLLVRALAAAALFLLASTGASCGAQKGTVPPDRVPETDVKDGEEKGSAAKGETVRVAIALEGASLAEAGFTSARTSGDPEAMAYQAELEERQNAVIAMIEEALGHPLRVVWRFTRNTNAISANVLPEEIEIIRGVEGVRSVTPERLNRPHTVTPGTSLG